MALIREHSLSRRSLLQAAIATAGTTALGVGLAACGGSSGSNKSKKIGTTPDEIAALAKKEGKLQLIAYPKTWANYGGSFKAFTAKYGIPISVANPDGSSAQELTALKTLKGQSSEPDVVDIGYEFTQQAISQKLIAQYKPANWAAVPTHLKDPDGWWTAAYYGVISIGADTKKVPAPTTMKDLLKPIYKGKVSLGGDPRTATDSFAAVFAAAIANGGSADNVQPGIDFFAELVKNGNFVKATSNDSALSTGQAAVVIDWNFNLLGFKPDLKKSGVDLAYSVPTDAVFGNYYAQPVAADCPQPNAGRLWVDWLTSDEGSEQYALGGAVPARFEELVKAGSLSAKALASLPDPTTLKQITFPTAAQAAAAQKLVMAQWGSKVLNA
ncbi:ABC transporter substrate-binding protein [Flexivirga caeni]|uniref:Extracellular solute-binding protein n=1 Tax=Flexivirga caeni TaxID=2294115 RepID=A0A3M9M252_9MICO|nr:extracellular solute-binding protein [Flexivirga caeni]RNI18993.1 extracellular solute-binding protein [Flexivirga caeni]